MAFFDADKPVDNSKLKELGLLVDKKANVYKKKDILYYEKDGTTLEVAAVLREKKDGTIKAKIIAMAAKDSDDKPIWDVSNFAYDSNKLENQLKKGKYEKVSQTLFEGKDTIWGSHLDDTLYGFDGKDEVDGWRGNDVLYGGKGDDTLIGNIGDDRLIGGPGKDLLKGGPDADTFVFNEKIKKSNIDTIYKFDLSNDTIELSQKIFSEFDKGTLKKDQFTVGKKAEGDGPQIIYQSNKGNLRYDPDGDGPADALKFANVQKHKDFSHVDFIVA